MASSLRLNFLNEHHCENSAKSAIQSWAVQNRRFLYQKSFERFQNTSSRSTTRKLSVGDLWTDNRILNEFEISKTLISNKIFTEKILDESVNKSQGRVRQTTLSRTVRNFVQNSSSLWIPDQKKKCVLLQNHLKDKLPKFLHPMVLLRCSLGRLNRYYMTNFVWWHIGL